MRTKAASIERSSCLGRAMIAASGLRSVRAPGSRATIGVFGSTTMVCSPPLSGRYERKAYLRPEADGLLLALLGAHGEHRIVGKPVQ
jgi:hypothetical protein